MIAVLTGTDIIVDSSGSAKILEFNTDVDLAGSYSPYFKKDVLLSYMQSGSMSKLVVIDKGTEAGFSLVRNDFYDDLAEYFTSASIDVERVFVDYDAIDLLDLNITDDPTTLYFRVAYDVYNPLDNTYASNKMLFRELMIDTGHADMMPRFSGLLYGLGYYNDIPEEFTTTDPSSSLEYPDLVAKNVIQDVSTGITFYKIVSGSSELRDSIFMNNDYVEEFIPTNYDNHTGFFRTWNMVDASGSITYLGGYLTLNPNEIPTHLDVIPETGLVKKYQYSSFLQTTIGSGHGLSGTSLVKLIDNTYIPMKDLQIGDQVATIKLVGLPDESEGPYAFLEWYVSGSQLPSGSVEEFTTVMDKWPVTVNVTLKIVTIDDISTEVGLFSQILYWSQSTDRIRFMTNAEIQPGDKVLTPSGEFVEVKSIDIIKGKQDMYLIDVESADYYLIGNLLTHNATTTKPPP